MAVYRLHRKEWDKGAPPPPGITASSKKRKAVSQPAGDEDDEAADDLEELPSPDLLTQADILEKYFGIEYDSDQSRGC